MCLQGAVYETIPRKLPFVYDNLGELELKGFDEPVRTYAARMEPGASVPSPVKTSGGRRTLKLVAFVFIAIVSAGFIGYHFWDSGNKEEIVDTEIPEKPSIAVLPFKNLSNDSEQSYFADGLTEDLTTNLSLYRELFVISRNSAFVYKDRAVDAKQVGQELGSGIHSGWKRQA